MIIQKYVHTKKKFENVIIVQTQTQIDNNWINSDHYESIGGLPRGNWCLPIIDLKRETCQCKNPLYIEQDKLHLTTMSIGQNLYQKDCTALLESKICIQSCYKFPECYETREVNILTSTKELKEKLVRFYFIISKELKHLPSVLIQIIQEYKFNPILVLDINKILLHIQEINK